jgi:hypothetical protein
MLLKKLTVTDKFFAFNKPKVHRVHRGQQLDPTGQCSSAGGTCPTVDIFSRLGGTRALESTNFH